MNTLTAEAVHKSFYVDDRLVGADSIEEAIIQLQCQLQDLFPLFTTQVEE